VAEIPDRYLAMQILVLNAGSSSLKVAVVHAESFTVVWSGMVDWSLSCWISPSQRVDFAKNCDRLSVMQDLLREINKDTIAVVGHRVVHGGDRYRSAVLIDEAVKQAIKDFACFAPIHNPAALESIELITQVLGEGVPQVAVFDTAFHANLPITAAVYPIPYKFYLEGIRRYGFHGTSHQYVARRASELLGRDLADLKLITCHLGNGCSLAAIANGQSIDTTMGFTPLSGLMMGTRSGDIDPSILLYLGRSHNMTFDQLDDLLNRQSGLLGVSGISSDLRTILQARREGHAQAKLAYDLFIHRLRSEMGRMLAVLGGLDGIVFTGGIGENSADVRADTLALFGFLGVAIDPTANQQGTGDRDISTADSPVRVLVVHTQEDIVIAHAAWQLVQNQT
jgi:acetate kinase